MPGKGQKHFRRSVVQMLELVVQSGSGLRDCNSTCLASHITSLQAHGAGGWAKPGSAGVF